AGEAPPEIVQVYEKVADGIWSDCGRFELVDAEIKDVPVTPRAKRTRKVFRFYLRPSATPAARSREDERVLSIARQIPTAVKVEVWKRDAGRCVQCGATDNLHFDHDVPWSKGGSSITAANVKVLCARHNLEKSDKILSLGPLLGPLVGAAIAAMMRGA
ncbi:MAG: HNH endonuclease, partial [Phycisphaerales bacterium]